MKLKSLAVSLSVGLVLSMLASSAFAQSCPRPRKTCASGSAKKMCPPKTRKCSKYNRECKKLKQAWIIGKTMSSKRMADMIAIDRIKKMGIKYKKPKVALDALESICKKSNDPAIKRIAMYAGSEVLESAGKYEEAIKLLAKFADVKGACKKPCTKTRKACKPCPKKSCPPKRSCPKMRSKCNTRPMVRIRPCPTKRKACKPCPAKRNKCKLSKRGMTKRCAINKGFVNHGTVHNHFINNGSIKVYLTNCKCQTRRQFGHSRFGRNCSMMRCPVMRNFCPMMRRGCEMPGRCYPAMRRPMMRRGCEMPGRCYPAMRRKSARQGQPEIDVEVITLPGSKRTTPKCETGTCPAPAGDKANTIEEAIKRQIMLRLREEMMRRKAAREQENQGATKSEEAPAPRN